MWTPAVARAKGRAMHPHVTAAIAADHRDELRRAAETQRLVDQARRAKPASSRATHDHDDDARALRWLAGNLRWSLAMRRLRGDARSTVANRSDTRGDQHLSTQRHDDSPQRGRVAPSAQMPANEAQTRA
jgi:hypothetical protein